ncbi:MULTISPECIES: hypothetical protein [Aeromonas]|jgi:hypothetical protein|uniref:Uncharacterized protein n=2 Tax=Aeromonadaceae TaxID=84642 RepID=A0ABT7Q3I9_9GAMM|nr:hypothetical protein [Aeromonas bestiarum]MDM5073846.1 hypothetical protein [Aeromonas bestiarum]
MYAYTESANMDAKNNEKYINLNAGALENEIPDLLVVIDSSSEPAMAPTDDKR